MLSNWFVVLYTKRALSVFYHNKGGSFWTEKLVLYNKKGVVLSWKVSVLPQKRGSFSKWRTRMGTIISVSEGARVMVPHVIIKGLTIWYPGWGFSPVCLLVNHSDTDTHTHTNYPQIEAWLQATLPFVCASLYALHSASC